MLYLFSFSGDPHLPERPSVFQGKSDKFPWLTLLRVPACVGGAPTALYALVWLEIAYFFILNIHVTNFSILLNGSMFNLSEIIYK